MIKKQLYPFCVMALAVILAFLAMLRSTYFSAERAVIFLAGVIICIFMTAAAVRFNDTKRAGCGAGLAAVLSLGNMTAFPMLYYTDGFNDKSVSIAANDSLKSLLLVLSGAVAAAVLLRILMRIDKTDVRILPVSMDIICVLTATAVILLSDKDSGTTIIFGMQAAIPAAAVILIAAAAAVKVNRLLFKLMSGVSALFVAAALVLRNETGIPVEVFAALLLWYMFFAKIKNKAITVTAILISASACGGILFLKFFGSRLSGITIVDKVMTRMFSGSVEQAASAKRSLAQSGVFGSNSYMYLSEGTSDFCFVTLIHYLGIVFLFLTLLIAIPFFCIAASELMKERNTLANTLSSMSFCLLTVMSCYNMLMCVDLVPIIGVQMPFLGNSKLFSLLSGCLMGFACYSEDSVDKLSLKIKKVKEDLL